MLPNDGHATAGLPAEGARVPLSVLVHIFARAARGGIWPAMVISGWKTLSAGFGHKNAPLCVGAAGILTGLDDVSGHDLAAGHGFGALVGLDGPVRIVGAEGEGDLVAGLADLGDGLLPGVGITGNKTGKVTAAQSRAEQVPGGRIVVLANVLEIGRDD